MGVAAAVAEAPAGGREPIAIVGIGCRFPRSDGPQAFWSLLRGGVDTVSPFAPPDRWDVDAFPDPGDRSMSYSGPVMIRWGAYLDRVDEFDWKAFRVSPREAKFADPQHRLLLEVSWEALEDAGLPLEQVAGSRTSVFIGIMWPDYAKLQARDYRRLEGYSANGNAFAYAANRISYFYDLHGPSVAVDVQCASSLTSVHLACQSIWSGDSEAALAGGVNLIVSPDTNIAMAKAAILSPRGRCRTWDAGADGFVRGEGAGLVVLRPLSKALADGDRVYAVIRASAVSHGGKTDWIMAPSRPAQEALLRDAYTHAGLDPRDVDYIELHGTGTKAGDPVEAAALGAVVGAGRMDGRCKVGTVKTNIGHLDSAAGIAGLIKAALSVHHREIPPSLHFEKPNPEIPLDELRMEVQTEHGPWPDRGELPVAGVTALSFGGGHAHMVLTGAPEPAAMPAAQPLRPYLLPLSARSEEALALLAHAYRDFLSPDGAGAAAALADVCHTATLRRSHHEHRAAIVARTREELLERLDALGRGEPRRGLHVGSSRGEPAPVVFLFPGPGHPWAGGGRELLEREPALRDAVAGCAARLADEAPWSLLDAIAAADGLDRPGRGEPALLALQMGLVELWRSFGLEPGAVLGHSAGEVAAAWCAGALDDRDAARLAVQRGRIADAAPAGEAMAALLLERAEAERLLGDHEGLTLAAENAPGTVVVAGAPDAIAGLVEQCRERGIYAAPLAEHEVFDRVPAGAGESLAALIGELEPTAAAHTLFSTYTGGPCAGPVLDAGYWARQVSEPVELRSALEAALDAGHTTFVELAGQPVLAGAIGDCLREREVDGTVIPSLVPGEPEQWTMLDGLAALHVAGHPVDLGAALAEPGRCISLPTHPWIRERMWIESEGAREIPGAPGINTTVERSAHPLLGGRVSVAGSGERVWEAVLEPRGVRYLEDHKVQGATVVAGATYVEMVSAAAEEELGWPQVTLHGLELRRALVVPGEGRRVQLRLAPDGDDRALFEVHSRPPEGGSWTLHVSGRVEPGTEAAPDGDPDALRAPLREELEREDIYKRLLERGEGYGPAFQGIARLWRRPGEALAEIAVPPSIFGQVPDYRFHPALLDACMHTLVLAAPGEGDGGFMPTEMGEIRVHGAIAGDCFSHVVLTSGAEPVDGRVDADIRVLDANGRVQIEVLGLRLQFLDEAALQAPLRERWYYEVSWQAEEDSPAPAAPAEPGAWVVLADSGGTGDALAKLLTEEGDSCVVVQAGADPLAGLRDALAGAGEPPPRGIVHLWGLDADPVDDADAASVADAQVRGCGAALEATRWAIGAGGGARIHLVTKGAQDVGRAGGPVAALQAPLWGFGRSLAGERPELWGGLLDLDPAADPQAGARAVRDRLRAESPEDQCAVRDGQTYVARLAERRVPAQERPLGWRRDAAYLITGGLGDLGLAVARWLADQGARHLVLMGRTPLPERAGWSAVDAQEEPVVAARIAAVRDVEARGAAVHVAAVDVGDEEDMRSFLAGWAAEGRPPIRGVVHSAGVAPFEALEDMSHESLAAVLRPKVAGGWLLHRLFDEHELDFLVLFASASGVLSSPRLAHYAAGNAFLDSLAGTGPRRTDCAERRMGPVGGGRHGYPHRCGGPGGAARDGADPTRRGARRDGAPDGRRDQPYGGAADRLGGLARGLPGRRARAAARRRRRSREAPEAEAAAAPAGDGAAHSRCYGAARGAAGGTRGAPVAELARTLRVERGGARGRGVARRSRLRLADGDRGPLAARGGLRHRGLDPRDRRGRLRDALAGILEGRVAEAAEQAGDPYSDRASGIHAVTVGELDWVVDALSDAEVEALLAELEAS